MAVIDHVVLEGGGRAEEPEQVVPAAGRHLGGGHVDQPADGQTVHGHVHVVRCSPALHVVVEPTVVAGHGMAHLEDLQALPPLPGRRRPPGARAATRARRGGGQGRGAHRTHRAAP